MLLFLLILSLGLCTGIVFQRFRANLGKYIKNHNGDLEFFKYSVLLRLFLLFVMIPFLPILLLVLFIGVYNLNFPVNNLQLIIFCLAQVVYSFAIGIYFTSIIIELFVAKSIKGLADYKSLRIAIKFFHGPVSHVTAYFGLTFYMFVVSFFDTFKSENIDSMILLAGFSGLILGLIIGVEQRINLTWRYQFPAFLSYFLFFILFIITGQIELKQQFTIFNLSWLVAALLYFVYKAIKAKVKGESNLYSEANWRI